MGAHAPLAWSETVAYKAREFAMHTGEAHGHYDHWAHGVCGSGMYGRVKEHTKRLSAI
ncbi:uncharacterized protein G2W53_040635 [Senna tora]|uniref:Uncharacterized protein n=1 Tax=Senna tora TaxID=362788 RepID=A0A834SQ65_9FABA|nr:uncharacterized protein G2W53_040635 [Senna tora]